LVKDCDAESGKKRSATPEVKDEDAQAPAAKKTKAEDGTARPTRARKDLKDMKSNTELCKQIEEDRKAAGVVVKGQGKRGAAAAFATDGNGKDDTKVPVKAKSPEPELKTSTVVVKGRGKRGAAAPVATDGNSKDDTKVPVKAKTPEPEMKTVVKKGKAPVDDLSLLQHTHHVYVGQDGCAMDGTFNLTDIRGNNNKFYQLQLLESDNKNPNGYCVFAHWGRVGERGQNQFKAKMVPLRSAEVAFDKAMKSKSGQPWAFRQRALGGGSKYAYLVIPSFTVDHAFSNSIYRNVTTTTMTKTRTNQLKTRTYLNPNPSSPHSYKA
jgi:predicted DNA-binding WGR domain protein